MSTEYATTSHQSQTQQSSGNNPSTTVSITQTIISDSSVNFHQKIDRAVFRFLSDSQAATDLEDGLRGDAVEFADGADCGAVVDGNSAEGIT